MALTELVLFSPALLFALRRRSAALAGRPQPAGRLAGLVLADGVADPFRDGVDSHFATTVYTSGFSARFQPSPGAWTDVRSLVGAPLGELALRAQGTAVRAGGREAAVAPSDSAWR